ncbi:MAG: aminopeptidase P N-terminal domain-containing protein, partial [Bacteroidota bacterium]
MKLMRFTISPAMLLVVLTGFCFAQELKYLEYDTDQIAPSVYKARREKVMEQVGSDAIALFYSAPVRTRNNDVEYHYRQDDHLYYLTGFTEPNAVLLLVPKGVSVKSIEDTTEIVTVREILFVQR